MTVKSILPTPNISVAERLFKYLFEVCLYAGVTSVYLGPLRFFYRLNSAKSSLCARPIFEPETYLEAGRRAYKLATPTPIFIIIKEWTEAVDT
jgi:hypothetical protein